MAIRAGRVTERADSTYNLKYIAGAMHSDSRVRSKHKTKEIKNTTKQTSLAVVSSPLVADMAVTD